MDYFESFKEKNFIFIDSLYYNDLNEFTIDIFLKDLEKIVYKPRIIAMTHSVQVRDHRRKGLYVFSEHSHTEFCVMVCATQEIFEQITVGLSYLDIDHG